MTQTWLPALDIDGSPFVMFSSKGDGPLHGNKDIANSKV